METSFRKKTSNILVTVLIGFIVVSFMFTGYESMRATPDTVIDVGGKLVKFEDYKREYDRQIAFYRQISGGKNLTSQQIEQFKIKDNIISNLINQKLVLKLGEKMDAVASQQEVVNRIKELPYFKTGEQFDLNRYKGILAQNGLNPKDFEDQIADESIGNKTQDYFKFIAFSESLTSDIINFKNDVKVVHLAEIKRSNLREFVPVLKSEIKEYLKTEVNAARVENTFTERKKTLDKPELVTASHILISSRTKDAEKKANDLAKKVNKNNFAEMAKKYTEDPGGKNNGGSLGEFGRGRMVPEFEKVAFSQKVGEISKPVKSQFGYHIIYTQGKKKAVPAVFENYRDEIAKELIQKEKTEELDKLMASLKDDIESNLKQGDIAEIKRLAKKYNLKFEEGAAISKYNGSESQISISRAAITDAFTGSANEIKTYEKAGQVQLMMITDNKAKDRPELTIDAEQKGIMTAFSRKYQQDMLKNIEENTSIKVYSNLIR